MSAAKKKPVQIVDDEYEEEIIDEPEESQEGIEAERKIDRFFNDFNGIESFTIKIYKKDGKKYVLMNEVHDEKPDIINDIQKIYGGGLYQLYAFKNRPDGSSKMMDTVTFNVADPIKTENVKPIENNERFKILQELQVMKEIVNPGGQANNTDATALMQIITQFNVQMMQQQQKSEERFNQLMLQLIQSQSKQGGLDEFIKMFDLVRNMVPAENSSPNLMQTLMPFAPAINSVIQQQIAQPAKLPIQPAQTTKLSFDQVKSMITPELREKITPENKNDIGKLIYDKLKGQAEIETIMMVLNNG